MEPFSQPPSPFQERVATIKQLIVDNTRVAVAIAIAVCVCSVALLSFLGTRPGKRLDQTLPTVSSFEQTGSSLSTEVIVYVAGAVENPGVFRFGQNDRVIDALEKAGDVTADADVAQINLAAKLVDGQRIYVPRKGEVPPPEIGGSASGPDGASTVVNLNTATSEQLEELPGVGPSTATSILSYRTKHGAFRSVDDLKNVDGIGDAKFEKLKDLVSV